MKQAPQMKKQKGKLKIILQAFISLLLAFVAFFCAIFFIKKTTPPENQQYIAHAGGGYKGNIYLNLQASFQEHYDKGTRIFEYDFMFSKDQQLIGTHLFEKLGNWNINNRPTFQEFENFTYENMGKGATISFVFDLIKNYPDITIIIDTKEEDEISILEKIQLEAQEVSLDVAKRIVPQLYSENNVEKSKNLVFEKYFFSNYKAGYTQKKLIELIEKQPKIKTVCISHVENLLFDNKKMNNLNVKVAIFTVNSHLIANFYWNTGASLIFTDFLF